jgi:hypothetical protein
MATTGQAAATRATETPARTGLAGRAAALARNPWGLAAIVGVIAAAVLWLIVQPLAGASNDTDAATTVLYFNRIVHGQHLEALAPTTPKPLLTLVYGLAWMLTGDWRTLTVLTIVAGASVVAMAARLAARFGGTGAAVIVAVGLLAWPDFALEVARSNSFIWGLAFWLLAGVLITADRPRPWLAGLALLAAGLCRTETVWLLGAAFACTAWVGWRAWRSGDRAGLRTAAPLLIGALFIPLACLHDLILTGMPLYWLGVPTSYTVVAYPDLASVSLVESIKKEIVYFRPAAALLVLALIGGAWLVLSRRRAVALALASLAGGVLLTLVVLAWRGIYISTRYYEEADAAILLAAAIGTAAVIRWLIERRTTRLGDGGFLPRAIGPTLLAAILVLSVVAVDVPHGTVDPQLAPSRQAYAELRTVLTPVSHVIEVMPGEGGTVTVKGANYPVADPASCRVFVPRQFVPVVSIEINVPVTDLGDSYLAFRDGKYPLKAGQWVLHISAADGSGGVYAPFENPVSATLVDADGQRVLIVPVVVDPQGGLWLYRVDAAPSV